MHVGLRIWAEAVAGESDLGFTWSKSIQLPQQKHSFFRIPGEICGVASNISPCSHSPYSALYSLPLPK